LQPHHGEKAEMKLFGYWRSGATYRVRIALELKNLDFEYTPINLLKGEQNTPPYNSKNPQGLVPSLEIGDGTILTQSIAIMEYLEEKYPENSILPKKIEMKAKARAIASSIACEAQPFMNLRVQQYLKNVRKFDQESMNEWLNLWAGNTMAVVENLVTQFGGRFCIGDEPSIADACLVPQWYAAQRFGIDISTFPALKKVTDNCSQLSAFQKAHPDNQTDAPIK